MRWVMQIKKQFITSHNKGAAGRNHPKYIVIHDTGNQKNGAGAKNHYIWLQTHEDTNQSAHIFVDDHEAIQVIPFDTPAWHTGKLYTEHPVVSDCTNFNSIGIEFCINQDGDLVKTLSNLVIVTKQVMQQTNIPLERVITHQMSSGKACPGTFVRNPSLYKKFRLDLKGNTSQAVIQAIHYLQAQGVTRSPDYWLEKIKEIEFLEGLILNMYQVLKKANER